MYYQALLSISSAGTSPGSSDRISSTAAGPVSSAGCSPWISFTGEGAGSSPGISSTGARVDEAWIGSSARTSSAVGSLGCATGGYSIVALATFAAGGSGATDSFTVTVRGELLAAAAAAISLTDS